MKTTFTFSLLIAITFSVTAQKHAPFSHQKQKTTLQKSNSLKNAQADYLPSIITNEMWENESWMYPNDVHYKYDENGNATEITTESDQTIKAYDPENRVIETIMKYYDGGLETYINSSKNNVSFDDDDEQTENINYSWDGSDWQMENGWKYVKEYDAHGEETSSIYLSYQMGVGWVEWSGEKTERIYDNDLMISETYYDREDGDWTPLFKNEWGYDNDGVLVSGFEYEHNGTSFVLIARYIDVNWYIWDNGIGPDGSHPYNYTKQTYNGTGDINDEANYTNSEKTIITYPEGHVDNVPLKIIETTYEWDSEWVESSRDTNITNSTEISELEETWNGSAWIPKEYFENNYPAFSSPGTTFEIFHVYSGGVLTEVHKGSSSYDTFGNIIEQKQESHTGDGNWVQSQGTMYVITYDGTTSKILQRILKNWDGAQSIYINYKRETYNYTPTNINANYNEVISIYPTVFDTNITIKSTTATVINFYSLTGVVVKQKQIFAGVNSIQTSELPKGYYILKVDNQTFKMVKR